LEAKLLGYEFYYIEAHIACILLVAMVFFKIVKGVNKQASQLYLGNLLMILMLYFVAEIYWAVVDGGLVETTKGTLYLSNTFTYILITFAAYYWFILSEFLQKDADIEKGRTRFIIAVPVILSSILCISAYWTGLLFYVDEDNNLVNGRFYFILIVVPFAYMMAASVKAFSRFLNKDKYAERNIYFMIGIFPFAPITLGALQAIFWRVPLLCYGAVAAVFYVYITSLDNLISIDPLTQTNNRNQMYKYLIQKMKGNDYSMSLFLLMVDIDRLRFINDAYGHAEGDRAIIRVSTAIKDACQSSRNRLFVSRYGGDEFVIVAEMPYKAEAVWLAEQIRNNVKRASANDASPYDLTVSVGIAQYDYKAPVSIQAFIARADSDLYQNKKLNAV
jgi:diguanylate cyclase (GGDEF)-like protein